MKKQPKAKVAPAPAPAVAVEEMKSLANLQTAYQGETNADMRYLSFARKADEEGYAPVASLFRAAARAEAIHARNHAEVIHGMHAEPKATIDPVVNRSTRENLEVAIQGEIYERDTMYPAFIQQARAEGNSAAVRTFHLALKAETEHAALFAQALQDLERLRGAAVEYYVCPVCGFTASKADGPRCPVCAELVERFEKIR